MDAVCRHLEAIVLNEVGPDGEECPQNLLITIPPGSSKSLLTSVFLPSWVWLFRPSWRAIFASGTPSIVTRDSLKCRSIIKSDWYQETFEPTWKISADQDEKHLFSNTAGGFRLGVGAGSSVTGARADVLFCDDANDAKEVHGKAHRTAINERWWDAAFHNRVANPSTSKRIVIMQRLHEEDLAGYLLEHEKGQWEHLCIPMEFDPDGPGTKKTWIGWTDPRTTSGELMFPSRFTPDYITKERLTLGSAGYAGQMQQRPSPAGGDKFHRDWWRFWSPTGTNQPRPKGCSEVPSKRFNPSVDHIDELIASVDCTFKEGDDKDFVVSLIVARVGACRYVLEVFRKQAGFSETQRAIAQQARDWPRLDAILIEDKANGSAVIETLSADIPGIIPVEPCGGKEARAAILEPKVEAGNWYLPEGAEWLDDWCEEFAMFPHGRWDDRIDARD
jgi:predicted phage terminase large subunit-like protein